MEKAVLLVGPSEMVMAGRLERLLAVLGVSCCQMTAAEFLAAAGAGAEKAEFRLLGSAATFLQLAEAPGDGLATGWQKSVHSAFVFAGGNPAALEKLARLVSANPTATTVSIQPGTAWEVTDGLPEFCQSMSGIRVAAVSDTATVLSFPEPKTNVVEIISTKHGAAFARIEREAAPIFLSTADIIDVGAPLTARNFDIRPHFLTAVPVVLYVKWALAGTCWQTPQTGACLVIDDPLLTPRYGFLNYQHLLNLMERVNFSTNIAFIPWNWNRSSRKIVRLFQENPKRLSLSVHGCDHTGGEFGSRNPGRLAWKSKQATGRMARHQSQTGLAHDAVMVFPQGVFSEAAMAALKQADFIGVVNTEVISTDPQPRPIKISDCWDVAVRNYSDCAIFTRRYPWQGVENFAFDILLGKACIVVVHHNDCYDDCRHVVAFIEKLNRLKARLVWSNLTEVVRRSFRQRELTPGLVEVEMYGREMRIENPGVEKKVFRVHKQESTPALIREIRADGQPVPWTAGAGGVTFELELNPGESRMVACSFQEPAAAGFAGENLRYRAKTMLRRYLCEVRDNYMMRKPAAPPR